MEHAVALPMWCKRIISFAQNQKQFETLIQKLSGDSSDEGLLAMIMCFYLMLLFNHACTDFRSEVAWSIVEEMLVPKAQKKKMGLIFYMDVGIMDRTNIWYTYSCIA